MGKKGRKGPVSQTGGGGASGKKKKQLLVAGGRAVAGDRGASAAAGAAATPDPVASAASRSDDRKRAVQAEESVFVKLAADRLEQLNLIATYAPLQRPIPAHLAVYGPERVSAPELPVYSDSSSSDAVPLPDLRIPKRPRWHNLDKKDKKTVESNEAEIFRVWLKETDSIMQRAFDGVLPPPDPQRAELFAPDLLQDLPPSGTAVIGSLFERNVEVFRQLWRVGEKSDILCVLLDTRCPLLHLPPSLVAYLQRFSRMRTLLVLTKADLVPAPIVSAWKAWLQKTYAWRVVTTESYVKKEKLEGQGSRARWAPYLSPSSRAALFKSLREIHQELITPPASVAAVPERLASWKPPCPVDIDWDEAERAGEKTISLEAGEVKRKKGGQAYITVGLIGQPNVGKSSLLNAIAGSSQVRASKTPGKTKHFQTHYISPSMQLADSPGLVFPGYAGLEHQVLAAILPISQVQAISSCVRYAASHLPLEEILSLDPPPIETGGSATSRIGEAKGAEWTSARILEALAIRHQYKTAKAGRPDLNRAGNGLLRLLAEGKIRWAFRPPPLREGDEMGCVGEEALDKLVREGKGIWLGPETLHEALVDTPRGDASEEESEEEVEQKTEQGEVSADESSESEEEAIAGQGGMFAALAIDDGESEEEDDSE